MTRGLLGLLNDGAFVRTTSLGSLTIGIDLGSLNEALAPWFAPRLEDQQVVFFFPFSFSSSPGIMYLIATRVGK